MYETLHTEGMAKVVPFSEARARLGDLIDEVARTHEHVVITRRGRPVAIVLSADDWEAVEETLGVLEDRELVEALRESADDVAAGRVRTLVSVRRDLGLD